MISILCPTRNRPHLVQEIYQSILDTVSTKPEIEFLLHVDNDDQQKAVYLNNKWLNTRIITGPTSSLGTLYNRLYRQAKGNILMLTGDDMVFKTPNWNQIVQEKADQIKDNIFYLYGDVDPKFKTRYANYLFVSRKVTEIVDYFAPNFLNRCIDSYLHDIAIKTERAFHIPILVEHKHYMNSKRKKDTTDIRLTEKIKNDKSMYANTLNLRIADAELLKNYINKPKPIIKF
jgi:glycosyltransferase involved in cell wall biosynthesis